MPIQTSSSCSTCLPWYDIYYFEVYTYVVQQYRYFRDPHSKKRDGVTDGVTDGGGGMYSTTKINGVEMSNGLGPLRGTRSSRLHSEHYPMIDNDRWRERRHKTVGEGTRYTRYNAGQEKVWRTVSLVLLLSPPAAKYLPRQSKTQALRPGIYRAARV